eukprot:scaffold90971_cov56-Prasinocladus_malaysianus.AAC.1
MYLDCPAAAVVLVLKLIRYAAEGQRDVRVAVHGHHARQKSPLQLAFVLGHTDTVHPHILASKAGDALSQ